jgi:hypothetical protein
MPRDPAGTRRAADSALRREPALGRFPTPSATAAHARGSRARVAAAPRSSGDACYLENLARLVRLLRDHAHELRGRRRLLLPRLLPARRRRAGERRLRARRRGAAAQLRARIVVENRRACGVVLENGQRVAAGRVVSNADVVQTVAKLVGRNLPPRYLGRSTACNRRSRRSSPISPPTCRSTPEMTSTDLLLSFVGPRRGLSSGAAPSWVSVTVPTLADRRSRPQAFGDADASCADAAAGRTARQT